MMIVKASEPTQTPPALQSVPVEAPKTTSETSSTDSSLSRSDSAKWSGMMAGAAVGAGAAAAGLASLSFVGEAIYPTAIAKVSLTEGIVFKNAFEKSLFFSDMAGAAGAGALFGALTGAVAGYQVGKHAENPTEGAKIGAQVGLGIGAVMCLATIFTEPNLFPAAVLATGISVGLGAMGGYWAAPHQPASK